MWKLECEEVQQWWWWTTGWWTESGQREGNEGCFPPDWTFLPCTSACASTRVFCTSIVQKCEVCTSLVSNAPALQPPVHCTRCTLQSTRSSWNCILAPPRGGMYGVVHNLEGPGYVQCTLYTPIHPYSSLESQGSVRPFFIMNPSIGMH